MDMFNLLFCIISGMFGAVFGSFCNVCIYRFPRGESIIHPASHCPQCQHKIDWYDNIPVLSWLFLRGRCRHCHTKISLQYPLVELVTGILFIIIFLKFRFTLSTIVYSLFTAGLVVVIVQDLKTWTIPDEITLSGILIGVGVSLLGMFFPEQGLRIQHPMDALDGIALGALLICLLDLIVILILKKPGMGFGDVKLLSMLGAFLGWRGVLGSLMIGSLIGSVIGFFIIAYYRLFSKEETSDIKDDNQDNVSDFYPVDPVSAIVLGVSAIYLEIRTLLFLNSYTSTEIPYEVITGLVYLITAFLLLALFVDIVSLWVWQKQKGKIKIDEELPDEEIQISLKAHYIPFGPYLSLGGFIFLLFGPELIEKYIQILSI
ncbi:MAG: prepilin peptidase [Candidatus Hydrogenedens sp.]|nr:prepilin peptidase [Candidatus Hydrogenedens sp.]